MVHKAEAAHIPDRYTLQVGARGRLILPAAARHRLGIGEGDRLVLTIEADGAVRIARLRPLTRARGLSLGDRACLALGQRLALPVLTADRSWEGLDLGVEIRLVR